MLSFSTKYLGPSHFVPPSNFENVQSFLLTFIFAKFNRLLSLLPSVNEKAKLQVVPFLSPDRFKSLFNAMLSLLVVINAVPLKLFDCDDLIFMNNYNSVRESHQQKSVSNYCVSNCYVISVKKLYFFKKRTFENTILMIKVLQHKKRMRI